MATTTAAGLILDPSRELPPPRAQWSDGQNRQQDTEDAASWLGLLGGGALALFKMSRGTLGGMALAALGGALAYRGAASNARMARTTRR